MYGIKRMEDTVLLELQNEGLGHTIFTTYAWIQFLKKNQGIEPIVLELSDKGNVEAYFVGGIVKKMGIKILGSPFEGWLTCDMGFIKIGEIDASEAIKTVVEYAIKELKCWYVQIIDKEIKENQLNESINFYKQPMLYMDISGGFQNVYENFSKKAKRYIRQSNDRQEIVPSNFDYDFIDIYYEQLEGIFIRQKLKPTFKKKKIYDLSDELKEFPELVCAEKAILPDGTCSGTSLTFGFGKWCYYLCAANARMKNNAHPAEGLFWSMTRNWISKGIINMDLVGIRDYKMRYSPEITEEIVIYGEKIKGMRFCKEFARYLIEKIRKLKGRITLSGVRNET